MSSLRVSPRSRALALPAAGALALAAALSFAPSSAKADFCGEREASTVFSCAFQKSSRVVNVCRHEGNGFQYVYGKPGQEPELVLNRRPSELVYTPWNGIGRAIFASLGFRNGEYLYEVAFNYDKFDQVESSVLLVYKGDNLIAEKACRRKTLVHELMEIDHLF